MRIERRRSRGFSLVEMLVVVAITGILAAVGVMLFRKYLGNSKSTEAMAGIQAIRAAEESYLAENHIYLDVSTGANTLTGNVVTRKDWYPALTPSKTRYEWHQPSHPDYARWAILAPAINKPMQFGFLVYAGVANAPLPPLQVAGVASFSSPNDDWYVVQAEGDTDGNGVFAQYATASSANAPSGQIFSVNEGE